MSVTDSVGTFGTLSLTEHVQQDGMLRIRCLFAVSFHIFVLPYQPVGLGSELAAIDQALDTILVMPVVWEREV